MALIEALYLEIAAKLSSKRVLKDPFPRISYVDAIDRYGSDKMDMRFGLELMDVSNAVRGRDFRVFTEVLENGGIVKALVAPGAASSSRRQINELEQIVKTNGASGLATIALGNDGSIRSPLERFFGVAGLK